MKRSPFDEPDFVAPELVEISSVADAMRLLAEWQAAYDELRRDYIKLHRQMIHLNAEAASWRSIAENESVLRLHGISDAN